MASLSRFKGGAACASCFLDDEGGGWEEPGEGGSERARRREGRERGRGRGAGVCGRQERGRMGLKREFRL